jgi:hypothetical protein
MRALLRSVLLRLLEQPIDELVQEALAEQDLPDEGEMDALRTQLVQANTELERLTGELERMTGAMDVRRSEQPKPSPKPSKGCKVPDCGSAHRSKGFCSKHYAAWRRGRLEGYVGPDGTLHHGERTWSLSVSLAGEAFTIEGGRLLVAGAVVGAT